MALVKYGGGIVQFSGSIAGNTFARNRSGNYVRSRTKPTNPNTARQNAVRGFLSTLTDRWSQTLTANQRTAWNDYGQNVVMKNKLGEDTKFTGFNHYIRSNTWRLDLGQATIDDGPVIYEVPAKDGTVTVGFSEATQQVDFTFDDGADWCSEDDAGIMIIQGQPQNAQRNFFKGPWRGRSAKMGSSIAPITTPQNYVSIWAISEGQRCWVQFRIIRADGRISEPFAANAFCAA